MFYHLKESTIFTWKAVATFFAFFWFALVVLFNWLRGFPLLNDFYTGIVVKALVVLVGFLITGIPWWALIFVSFLPMPVIGPIFFVAFILMFAK